MAKKDSGFFGNMGIGIAFLIAAAFAGGLTSKNKEKEKPIQFTRKQFWLTILFAQLVAIGMHSFLKPYLVEFGNLYIPWY